MCGLRPGAVWFCEILWILTLAGNSSVFCFSKQQVAVGLGASDFSLLGAEGSSLSQTSINFGVWRLKGFSDILHLMPTREPGITNGSEEQLEEFNKVDCYYSSAVD